MDRGVPTEDSLAKMRRMGASYLVGTPKGRLTKLEQGFLAQPWQRVREGVDVKRLAVTTRTPTCWRKARRASTRSVRCGNAGCAATCAPAAVQGQTLTRDQLLMKLGAARHDAGRAPT